MKIFKRTYGISTTDIVGRLLLLTKEHHLSTKRTHKLSQDFSEVKIPSKTITTTSRIKNFTKDNKVAGKDDKIVYIASDWDILHAGHVRILKNAKQFGDFLIVGIYDDDTINQLKGFNFPIQNLHERVLNILALRVS